jgi:outer membrane protein assembly factor BamA
LAPLLYGNINVDDGVFLGGGFFYTTHGFRKSPYKSQHIFLGSYAFNTSSFNFKYDGRFSQVIGKWNLEVDADIKSPNFVNNFFGMGNESVFNKEINKLPDVDVEHAIQYYRLRFKEYSFNARISRQVGQYGFFKVGPAYQQIEIEDAEHKDRFISAYAETLSRPLIEISKSFAGLNYSWGIDKRNEKLLTTRGIYLEQNSSAMLGMKSGAKNFLRHQASVSFYQTFKFPAHVTFALRAGGGITQGDYEIYQAQILDGKTELRGFRKTRFYGDKKFFTNSEVRIKLANVRSYLFPASFGALGFYDVGRVWYKDANGKDSSSITGKSNTWHNGVGGGLWITPFNLTVLSVEVGHSVEGTLFYARLGFLF